MAEAEITAEEQSFLTTKDLLYIAIFNIAYIRGLFPEKYFTDKNVLPLAMKIKKLMQLHPESYRIIDWMEKGVYDALQKKYLKTIWLCVCETVEGPIIEEHAFSFHYPNSECQEVSMNINCTGTKKQEGTFKYNSTTETPPNQMRSSACKMIRTLVQEMRSLDKMPEERTILMRLNYYDDVTPADYEPPFFRGFSEEESHNAWTKSSLKMEVGNAYNKHFVFALKVKGVLDPCEDENVDIEEGDASLGVESQQKELSSESDSEPRLGLYTSLIVKMNKLHVGSSVSAANSILATKAPTLSSYPTFELDADTVLIIEVYDSNGGRIFRTVRPRVTSIWNFKDLMFHCWCDRHALQDPFLTAYLRRAHRMIMPIIWPNNQNISFLLDRQLFPQVLDLEHLEHFELEDIGLLAKVLVVENIDMLSRSYGEEYNGMGYQALRGFVVLLHGLLQRDMTNCIGDGYEYESSSEPTMLIRQYDFDGNLQFQGLYLRPYSDVTFSQAMYQGWLIRHYVDDEFWYCLTTISQYEVPPIIWPGHEHIWYMFNDMLHLEPPSDWELIEEIVIYEVQSYWWRRHGYAADRAAGLTNILIDLLGLEYMLPMREYEYTLHPNDDYYG